MVTVEEAIARDAEKVLLRAAELVGLGWCQGALTRGVGATRRYCVRGALGEAAAHEWVSVSVMIEVASRLEHVTGVESRSLARWNDASERTRAEVVEALEEAARC